MPEGKAKGKPKYELDDLLKVRERSKDTAEVVRKISVSEVGGEWSLACCVLSTCLCVWTIWLSELGNLEARDDRITRQHSSHNRLRRNLCNLDYSMTPPRGQRLCRVNTAYLL